MTLQHAVNTADVDMLQAVRTSVFSELTPLQNDLLHMLVAATRERT